MAIRSLSQIVLIISMRNTTNRILRVILEKKINNILNRASKFGGIFMAGGLFVGFATAASKAVGIIGNLNNQYLLRYLAYPALLFIFFGFISLAARVLINAIHPNKFDNFQSIELASREPMPKTIKILVSAYVFLLSITVSLGFYLISSNFVLLVSGHLFAIFARR